MSVLTKDDLKQIATLVRFEVKRELEYQLAEQIPRILKIHTDEVLIPLIDQKINNRVTEAENRIINSVVRDVNDMFQRHIDYVDARFKEHSQIMNIHEAEIILLKHKFKTRTA